MNLASLEWAYVSGMGGILLTAVVTAAVAYLCNQLPPIEAFPGRNWLIARLFLWATLIAVAQQGLASEKITQVWAEPAFWCLGAAAVTATAFDGAKLIAALRQVSQSPPESARVRSENVAKGNELRSQLLEQVEKQVKLRLKYAVGEQALINVAMQQDAEAVDGDEREGDVYLLPQAKQQVESFCSNDFWAMPSEATVLDTFDDEEIDGLLLILGAPGMGKTTALLKLAEALLARAEDTGEIPYIFELSAWRDPQQEIADWLMAQLKFDYGIDEKVSRGWILDGKLVPLLDGLDELPMKAGRGGTSQRLCVEKINEFVTEKMTQKAVVCCRCKEYETVTEASGVKLDALNGALQLQPLENAQIQRYFEKMARPEIWQALQDEEGLGKLMQPPERGNFQEEQEVAPMKIPLFVQMLAVAYAPGKRLTEKAELFDAYIARRLSLETRKHDRRLGRRKREGTTTKWAYESVYDELNDVLTIQYLSWLAHKLQKNDRTNDFLIEQIQPTWLKTTSQKWQYRITFSLIFGFMLALLGGLRSGMTFGLLGGVLFALAFGLSSSLIFCLIFDLSSIKTVETLRSCKLISSC